MRAPAEEVCAIALGMIDGIGPVTALRLIRAMGSARAVFEHNPRELLSTKLIHERSLRDFTDRQLLARAAYEAEQIERLGGHVSSIGSQDYPARLAACEDAPIALFSKGERIWDQNKVIAVVGTRKVTDYGRRACVRLLEQLQPYGVVVVSGLAYGVDICAHREAMRLGLPTIACLAHGLDRIYPSVHAREAQRMLDEGGAWVTDFPVDTRPNRENFPERNRLIAGLADATIVIESDRKGGSMITARLAASYHREVFALPGRIDDPLSAGCNALVRNLEAQILTHGAQIALELGWKRSESGGKQLNLLPDLVESQQKIYRILQAGRARHVDELQHATGAAYGELAKDLFEMELAGVIRHLPGKRYQLSG